MPTRENLDRERLLQQAGGYRFLAVVGAAAELNLFTQLGGEALSAEAIAVRLGANLRAATALLDALVALGVLDKEGEAVQRARRIAALAGRRHAAAPYCRCCGTRWA